ncbi:MAG TPA: hypothetical protein VKU88_10210 [Acidimicrobiales bacterium]|nr:hypothetical protein [Acidimicrobiales bacterium]
MKIRLLAGALLAAAGALVWSAPAQAVQTDTWGLAAAPAGNAQRTTLTHPANGSTVHDDVVVYNRTAKPIAVHLYVLSTNYANGVYQFGKPDTGLAADTSLGASHVELGPHQVVEVPVTIRMPRGTKKTMLAGVGGEAAPINHGVLSIEEQLVVLIKATPPSHLAPLHLSAPDVAGWGAAAAAMLAGVVGLTVRQKRHSPRLV